jgi:hypothetical protein
LKINIVEILFYRRRQRLAVVRARSNKAKALLRKPLPPTRMRTSSHRPQRLVLVQDQRLRLQNRPPPHPHQRRTERKEERKGVEIKGNK